MPYKVRGKCVYKKDTGKKVGCTDGSVKKYLAALHANANESIDHEPTNEDLEEIVLEEYTRLLNEGPPTPNLPSVIRNLTGIRPIRIPYGAARSPGLSRLPNVGKSATGTNVNLADEASMENLAQSIGDNPPWEISDIPKSPVIRRITQPAHYESELEQMTLPAPTETLAIDPALRQRYFGPDPDLMHRRVPKGVADAGDTQLEDAIGEMELVPDPSAYGWKPMGEGGFRRVYNIPGVEDKVLKVAIPAKDPQFSVTVGQSEMMNRMEALQAYQTHPSGLAAEVFEMAPDGSYVIQEKVTPFRDWSEMFEHFPNFKKGMELFSQGDPERSWKWRFTAADVYAKIIQLNKPLSKIEIPKTIEWIGRLENAIRNSKSEYTAAEIDRMVRDVSDLRMRPGIKAYEKTGELFGYKFGRDGLAYDERIIDYLNNLIADPVVSNIRDFARSVNQYKPAYAVWDYSPKNLGLDKSGKVKILDSGFGL